MNYGDLIAEAFRITWRNKFLWIFGIFIGAGGGSFNFPSGTGTSPTGQSGEGVPPWLRDAVDWASENFVLLLVVVALVVVALLVLSIFLSTVSRGGLAESVAALHRGEERRFGSTWRAGLGSFWRLLGLRALLFVISTATTLVVTLIILVPIALVVIVVLAVSSGSSSDPASNFGAIFALAIFGIFFVIFLLIVVFVPIAVVLHVVGQLATRELVVGGAGVLDSLVAGWRLFRNNLGKSLLVWVIQVAIGIGTGIALLIVFLVLGLILVGPAVLLFVGEYTTAAVVVGIVGGLVFLVLVLAITGAVNTFNHAYWTLAYLRLIDPIQGPADALEPAR